MLHERWPILNGGISLASPLSTEKINMKKREHHDTRTRSGPTFSTPQLIAQCRDNTNDSITPETVKTHLQYSACCTRVRSSGAVRAINCTKQPAVPSQTIMMMESDIVVAHDLHNFAICH